MKALLVGENRPPNAGRLLIYYDDKLGTVCGYGFDDRDAQVACYMLGFRYITDLHQVVTWLSGSALVSINVVTLCRARLILGWVTVYGLTILVLPATQVNSAFHPSGVIGSINEYRQYAGVKA